MDIFRKKTPEEILLKDQNRRNLILNGNLMKAILIVTLPLFLFSLINYVYGIIDMVMSKNISNDAVSAVASLDQIKNMVASIGGGLSAGASILISRRVGANDFNGARRLTTTAFIITAIIALLTVAIIVPLAPLLLNLVGVPKDLINIGTTYFRISIITAAVIMINTVFMGVEKARGTTAVITFLNLGVVIIKVALTSLFLFGFNIKDMAFVSLATLLANLMLTIFIIVRIGRKSYIFHFSYKEKDFSRGSMKSLTRISLPIFLGKFVFSLGKVVINGMCKPYGKDVVGALGVSNSMGGLVTNALGSVEDSCSAIIAQNLGNNNIKRALQSFYYSLALTLSLALVGVILVTIFNDQLVSLYSRDSAYADLITECFKYEKIGIIFLAINSSVMALLYGFGLTITSGIINLSRVFVFRIPILVIIQQCFADKVQGATAVGVAMGLSNVAIGIVAIIAAVVTIVLIKKGKIKKIK